MRKLVISTVGTSLITNQLQKEEKEWNSRLRQIANLSASKTYEEHQDVWQMLEILQNRAKAKLTGEISQIRATSAELNGIYGLYQEQLEQGKQDIHFLIATDTAQGQSTANAIKSFLQSQELVVDIFTPQGLSTASTESFASGIDQLLEWMETTIPDYQNSGYKVCFNLVGSFKSLQGYLNTIGMFYADEIIYIFEGSSEIITIPRLPITLDEKIVQSIIKPYVVEFALMAQGRESDRAQLANIPETLIYVLDNEVTLSNWGKLIWNRCKEQLLSDNLLDFPKLRYEPSFIKDYENIRNKAERVKLQETLAYVSHLLLKSNGNTAMLKQDGGLQYGVLKNTDNVGHFRVTLGLRISCKVVEGNLVLRKYGEHDYGNEQRQ